MNTIANTMVSNGIKVDNRIVENYLRACCDSFILYRADRYDVKGKRLLKTQNKYYLVDLGLRYFLLGNRDIDTGRMLENVVYLELLRRNRKVYIGKVDYRKNGKLDIREIDFVAESDGGTEYYQMSQSVLDPNTLERELASLNAVKDHNPKYLLTLDAMPAVSHNGIKQIKRIGLVAGITKTAQIGRFLMHNKIMLRDYSTYPLNLNSCATRYIRFNSSILLGS